MGKVSVLVVLFGLLIFSQPLYCAAKIDINTANKSQLMSLKGIGEKYAIRIIEYRKKNGPFKKLDELKNVKGIGAKTLTLNKGMMEIIPVKKK